ncbi:antibiotic biosynthesis monooxygenase family protein [Reichenbachiella sp. MALMAid0571]|uniref:putative quinol monooxygenase n=1 Tax=Reichenbachiella sp. MALMAid0571 TaxID=3143939 RepID=UPI0032DEFCD9
MIIRIVRMTFEENKEEDFLTIFNESKDKIRNFDGCTHLELLKDAHAACVYTTYSHWQNEQKLDEYRKSKLFKAVWAKTKPLFSAKPIAHSYVRQ